MSLNHYSQTTPYWATTQPHQNDNDEEDDIEQTATMETSSKQGAVVVEEKEAMFEKPLTPSDVGKLNRLVIPKQHAEKYFPLGGGGESGECKGLLLSFEDESGKCWRFRYSYWNSSQSYVLTKGWSRYVKEKRLDAGDVVSFHRYRTDSNRLFIGWRRRQTTAPAHVSRQGKTTSGDGNGVGGMGWTRGFYSAHQPYPAHHQYPLPMPYQHDCPHAETGTGSESEKQKTKGARNGSGSGSGSSSSRVLRLFGVNMECQSEGHDDQCSSYNNKTEAEVTNDKHHFYHHHSPNPHMLRHQPYYY